MGNNLAAPEDPVTNKHTDRGYSYSQKIKYAASGMKGLRATMEDKHIFANEIQIADSNIVLDDHSVFAVFDGHGGDFTSKYASENFMRVLSSRAEMKRYTELPKIGHESRSDVSGLELLRSALRETFSDLDKEIRPLQEKLNEGGIDAYGNLPFNLEGDSKCDEAMNPMIEHSGSTCIAVVVTPSHIIGCNLGDSRAILRRGGNVLPLSFDHKPSEIPERERITEAGGFVKARRVDGDLAVSRAFGDFIYKNENSLPSDKQKVIADPDILLYPRTEKDDEFIVLACDGVWDVASSKQCADFVQTLLAEGESDLGIICEEALDTCLERNSKDNMTIMIVGFPGMLTADSHVALQNAVWGRRTTRRTKHLNDRVRKFADSIGAQLGINDTNASSVSETKCQEVSKVPSDDITTDSESDFSNDFKPSFQRARAVPAM